jgi:hypothetical protein
MISRPLILERELSFHMQRPKSTGLSFFQNEKYHKDKHDK